MRGKKALSIKSSALLLVNKYSPLFSRYFHLFEILCGGECAIYLKYLTNIQI